MLGRVWRLLTWPVRLARRVFKISARETGVASRTAAKSGGSAVAKTAAAELLKAEYREEPPSGVEAALFTQLPRPRLTERSASELSLEQAKTYAESARGFYRHDFPLFARGDFFYEEVEEEYLNLALGFEQNSIDRRFLEVTTVFRKALNDNTRRMLAYWTPALFLATFPPAAYFVLSDARLPFLRFTDSAPPAALGFGLAAAMAVLLAFLVYSWPFKVVQQRNLLNLDNYVTSKFARINNNFQVAKRRALNVERDKRIPQREELKDEAGSWTLAYHWFAMRLLLCELAIRNKFYQVRRNTTLYWVAGLFFTGALLLAMLALLIRLNADSAAIAGYVGASTVYLLIVGVIMSRATGMMFRVLESNEWSRFHLVNLDRTIQDHVGEDKLQIVTFRDRNRME